MPLTLVTDASVIINAYVPETLSDRAAELIEGMETGALCLVAPDLIYPETGNILWKKFRLKELGAKDVKEICDAICSLPLKIEPSKPLLPLAVALGIALGITVYDALYVALAQVYGTNLLTADKKLLDKCGGSFASKFVKWLGDAHFGS